MGFKERVLPFILGTTPLLSIVFREKWVPCYIVALLVAYFFEPHKRFGYQKNKNLLVPFVIMVTVYVFFTLVSSEITTSLKVLERQTSLLLLPALIFTSNWSHTRLAFLLRVFTIALAIFCIFSFSSLLSFYLNNQDWINTMNQIQDNKAYLLFKFPHLVNTHPTYWSYLLVIGNIAVLANTSFAFLRNSYVAFFLLLIFNVTLLFLAARTPLVTNLVIHLFALLVGRSLKGKFSWIKLISVVCIVGLIGVLVLPRISFLTLKFLDVFKDDRFYLWPVALQQIRENYFILGEGLGLGNNILKEFIILNGDVRDNYNSFDLHNQYLRHYLDMGILGLLSLLYLLFYPVLNMRPCLFHPKCFSGLGIALLFTLACLTEAPLYRLKGIIIFSIFYPAFLVSSQLLNEKKE